MKKFCLDAAFNSSPRKVSRMLATEALVLEAYYQHEAAQYQIGEPDQFGQYETTDPVEHEHFCQRAEDALEIATTLENSPAVYVILNLAALHLAEHCREIGDFEMADELLALAGSLNVQSPCERKAA
jgi:hypothetical protein